MSLLRWNEGRADVDRLLSENQLSRVSASTEMAQVLIDEATKHIESAALIASIDPSGSYQLSYDGSRKALTAVLQIQGLRPTASGGHLVIQECLKAQLINSGKDIVKKFSVMRRLRNTAEYPQQTTDVVLIEDALEQIADAREVLEKSKKLIEIMPVY